MPVEYLGTEGRFNNGRRVAEIAAAGAAEIRNVAHLQAGLARDDVDVRILQRRVRNLVLGIVEQLLRLAAAIFRIQVALALFEGLDRGGLDAVELDDVVAELRLDGPGDLAFLHAERGIGKRPHIARALRPAQIAPVLRRPRVLRKLLRELAEVLAALRALQGRLGLGLDRRIVLGAFDLEQNVPHAPLLGLGETLGRLGLLLVVVGFELGVIDVNLGGEVGEAHLDVTQFHRLRCHVLRFVRVVVGLDRRIVRSRLGCELGGRNGEPGDLTLLAREAPQARKFRGRDETRRVDGALHLTQLRIVTNHVLDLRDRAALRLEHGEGVREIPFAVHLQLRDAGHLREELLVGHPIPEVVGAGDERLGVDVLIEHVALQVRALGIRQLAVGLPLVAGKLLLIGLANVVTRDLQRRSPWRRSWVRSASS